MEWSSHVLRDMGAGSSPVSARGTGKGRPQRMFGCRPPAQGKVHRSRRQGRPRCTPDARRRDDPQGFCHLHRARTRPGCQAVADRRGGHAALPRNRPCDQTAARAGARGARFPVRQPMRPALCQRPAKPCRNGIHKTGNPETEKHSQTLHRFLQTGRRSLRPVAAKEMPKPLRPRRLWSGMRATRYSAPGSGMSPNPAMVQS